MAEAALFTDGEFFFQDQVEEVEVGHLVGVGPADVLGQRLSQVGQAELGGGRADPGDDQLAQRMSLGSMRMGVKGRVPVIWS
jgi:hypothetical protein